MQHLLAHTAQRAAQRGGHLALPPALLLSRQQQCLSSTNGAPAAEPAGLLEIREYTLHPSGMADFLKLSGETASLRSQLLPFLGMFTCDTGSHLNRVTHFYHYKDLEQREAVRSAAAKDSRWQAFIAASRPYVASQESRIMSEAAPIYSALGLRGAAGFRSPQQTLPNTPVYEFRQYQLDPGYGSVPKLVAAFADGLPEKVAADREGLLVTFAYSEIGVLNNVVELWRYPSAAACLRARAASRHVQAWRNTIATITPGVQRFETALLQPTKFSPWS